MIAIIKVFLMIVGAFALVIVGCFTLCVWKLRKLSGVGAIDLEDIE